MFSKILIANRGEIAVRIIRACKEMGIKTVAVYSEADRNALHSALADESICIGPAPAQDSYLSISSIISAALATKANAIHPGYGFLSENPALADECRKNGIAFIGPDAETMMRLSDKSAIKKLTSDAGLPVIPGTGTLSCVDEALKEAERIGYPVMLRRQGYKACILCRRSQGCVSRSCQGERNSIRRWRSLPREVHRECKAYRGAGPR